MTNRNLSAVLLFSVLAGCSSESNIDLADDANPGSSSSDGSAAGDGAVASRDPAGAGDFAVTSASATIPGFEDGRELASTIYTPTGATSPRPLVIVSPGFQMERAQYKSYAEHLTSWGFVVILTDYAESGLFSVDHEALTSDIPAVVTWALAQSSLAIDPARVAAVGHSLGGKLSIYAATKDTRIKAVVAWDPVDSNSPSVAPEKMTSMTAAIAVVGETTNGSGGSFGQSCAPTADNFLVFYAASPSPALAITVKGADHMDWVDDPSCFACGFCDPGTASPDLARTVSRRIDVAWLRLQLLGDTTMNTWIDAPPEAANLTLQRH